MIGNLIKGSRRYDWIELNINNINKDRQVPISHCIIPSTTKGKRMKLLVAPNKCNISTVSCFAWMIRRIVFDTRTTEIMNIPIPNNKPIPNIFSIILSI